MEELEAPFATSNGVGLHVRPTDGVVADVMAEQYESVFVGVR